MSNIEMFPGAHRTYHAERDWLTPGSEHSSVPRKPRGEVIQFTQKLAMCSICSSSNHRAYKCPARPGASNDDGA